MKYSELPVKTLEDIRNNKTVIICSDIVTDEENKIEKIEKCLVNAADFASKEEVIALTEQNSKLVQIVSRLVTQNQELEKTIAELKETKTKNQDIDSLKLAIEELSQRLENNIVEL